MQPPVFNDIYGTSFVKDGYSMVNTLFDKAGVELGKRVGAFVGIESADDLVELDEATQLDFAILLNGDVYQLTGPSYETLSSWTLQGGSGDGGGFLNASDLGVSANGLDQRQHIIDAVGVAASAGVPLFFPNGTYVKVGDAIPLPSNIELYFAPSACIKNANGTNSPVFTNTDTYNGNVNIKIHGGLFDGNRGGNTNSFYSTLDFTRVSHCLFDGISVRGGARQAAGSSGNGEGLVLRYSDHNVIRGGLIYENDYDGIKLRGSNYNTITGVTFRNNERSGVQISYPGSGVEITAENSSHHNTITGCTVWHVSGIVGGGGTDASPLGAAYVSGFGLHGCADNTVTGNTVYGTACGIDALEGSHRNIVSSNIFSCRPQAVADNAIIRIYDYNSTNSDRNEFVGNHLFGLSGANKRYVWIERAQGTLVGFNYFGRHSTDASGTWTLDSSSTVGSTRWYFNTVDANGLAVNLNEASPIELWATVGSFGVNTRGSSSAYGGGQGVLSIRKATTAPTSSWSDGGIIYVGSDGSLQYRGPSTVTQLAPA